MKKTNRIYLVINIVIWIFILIFLYHYLNSMWQVSPYGAHNLFTISLQLGLIFGPLIGLVLSILFKGKYLKYVLIFVNLIIIYFISFPFSYFWLSYLKV